MPASKSKRSVVRPSIAAAAFEALEGRQLMSAGALDTTFGNGGKFASQILPFVPLGVAVQKDGKTLAVGTYHDNLAVARVNVNGSIDSSFGPHGNGIAEANFSSDSGDDEAHGIAIQPDGKIVVVGRSDDDMAVARFDTAGFLDRSFNGSGLKKFGFHTFSGDGAEAFTVAVQSDGKILVGGNADDSGLFGSRDDDFALARLNTNGGLDGSFGDDGKVTFGMGGNDDRISAIAVQRDGKIVVGGFGGTVGRGRKFAVARFTSGGSLDKTFDGDGKASADFGTDAIIAGITLGGLDSVLAVGCVGNHFGMARFSNLGKLDWSFGNGTGMVTTALGSFDMARTAIITPDNQILVGGLSDGNFEIARYDIGGNIDRSFGTNGAVNTGFGGTESVYQLSTTTDGKVVALGAAGNDLLWSRYTATQPAVSVTATRTSTDEGRDDATFTFTRDQALSFPTRVYYTLGGTASLNADYTGPTLTLPKLEIKTQAMTRTFKMNVGGILGNIGVGKFGSQPYIDIPAGRTDATLTIKALSDDKLEPNETVTVALAQDAAYTIDASAGRNPVQTITINDENPLHINFQSNVNTVAFQNRKDVGSTFGDRGDGLSYGWDADNSSKMRIRNSAASPDFRYDSLALMQAGGANRKWEIAVPNGLYYVRLVAGDPNFTDSKYKMNLEGQLALSGTPSGDTRWFRSTSVVNVTDGRLTLSNANGSQNNKIDWIDIKAAPLGTPTGMVAGASNLPVNRYAANNPTQGTVGTSGLFSDTRIDDRQLWVEVRRLVI